MSSNRKSRRRRATDFPFPVEEWTPEQAAALQAFLGARAGGKTGALGYCELTGFLFALACSPELVRPAQWLPEVLGEREFSSDDEADRVLALLTALHNRINLDILEGKPVLPAGVELRADPMANFGPDAPLGKWAGGFSAGQLWAEGAWLAHIASAPEADRQMLEDAFEGINMILAFFTRRSLGQKFRRKMHGAPGLEEAARFMLQALPTAMQGLAQLGRGKLQPDDERNERR